jgi:hypothetical protein
MLIRIEMITHVMMLIVGDGKIVIIATIDIGTRTMILMEERIVVMIAESVDNTQKRIAIVTTNGDIMINKTAMKTIRLSRVKLFGDVS